MDDWKAVVKKVCDPSVFKAYLRANVAYHLRMIPLTFLAACVFHIFLSAFVYDGFDVPLGSHIIGRGNQLWGTVEWFVVPFLIFFVMGMARTAGTAFVMEQAGKIPSGFGMAAQELQTHIVERIFQEWLLIYTGAVSLAAQYLRGSYGPRGTVLFLALFALALSAFAIQLSPPSRSKAPLHKQLWFVALCVGLGAALGSTHYGGLGLFMAAGGLFLKWKRTSKKPPSGGAKIAFWLLVGTAWWFFSRELLLADDGGWIEFKGQNPDKGLWDWATDEGSRGVLSYGAAGGGTATGGGVAGDYAGHTAGKVLKGGAGGSGRGGPFTVPR